MKNHLPATYTFLVLQIISISVFGQDTTYNPGKLYTPVELKADLHFLQTQLDRYVVQPSLTDLLKGKDPVKTFAMKLISSN